MPARKPSKTGRDRRALIARRHGRWDAQQVAEHLMSCRSQIVCGLGHKPPWAGMDPDTLDSCFGHGAALIASIAAQGKREDWRTVRDLEKAQIAAFRNQAFDHWKRVNALSRRGDRTAIAFDPERHAAPDAQIERLFADPDVLLVKRDLLAELDDPQLRAFWDLVLSSGHSFKAAGDQLGLKKAQVMARTRAGRASFAGYLARRESGELCRERGADIVAQRAGTADTAGVERALAHLDSCYACALVYEPRSSAFERGVLSAAPIGLLLRMATRASDASSAAATRWTEAAAGARLAASGLAAVAVAGSGVGLNAATSQERSAASPPPAAIERAAAPAAVREVFRAPASLVATPVRRRAAGSGATEPTEPERKREKSVTKAPKRADSDDAPTTPSSSVAATPATPGPEFSFESPGAAAPAAPPATAPSAQPAASPQPTLPPAEFAGP